MNKWATMYTMLAISELIETIVSRLGVGALFALLAVAVAAAAFSATLIIFLGIDAITRGGVSLAAVAMSISAFIMLRATLN